MTEKDHAGRLKLQLSEYKIAVDAVTEGLWSPYNEKGDLLPEITRNKTPREMKDGEKITFAEIFTQAAERLMSAIKVFQGRKDKMSERVDLSKAKLTKDMDKARHALQPHRPGRDEEPDDTMTIPSSLARMDEDE